MPLLSKKIKYIFLLSLLCTNPVQAGFKKELLAFFAGVMIYVNLLYASGMINKTSPYYIRGTIDDIIVLVCVDAIAGLFGVLNYCKDNSNDIISHAYYDDTLKISRAIQEGQDVDLSSKDGITAIYWTTYNKNYPATLDLIKSGAGIEIRGPYGFTPLMHACSNNDERTLKLILFLGADRDFKNSNNQTALDITQDKAEDLITYPNDETEFELRKNKIIQELILDPSTIKNYCSEQEISDLSKIKEIWLNARSQKQAIQEYNHLVKTKGNIFTLLQKRQITGQQLNKNNH